MSSLGNIDEVILVFMHHIINRESTAMILEIDDDTATVFWALGQQTTAELIITLMILSDAIF